MNDYIEKKGKTAIIYDVNGDKIDSREVSNVSNLDMLVSYEKKHKELLKEKAKVDNEMKALSMKEMLGKLVTIGGPIAGVIIGIVAGAINSSGIDILPYMIGGAVAIPSAVYGITTTSGINEKYDFLKKKLKKLELESDQINKVIFELERKKTKVDTHEDVKKVKDTKEYEDNRKRKSNVQLDEDYEISKEEKYETSRRR